MTLFHPTRLAQGTNHVPVPFIPVKLETLYFIQTFTILPAVKCNYIFVDDRANFSVI